MINRSPTPSRVSVRLPAAWWPPARSSTGEERAGRGVNVSAGDTVRRWSYTVEEATTRETGAAGVEGDAGLDEFGDLPHYDKLLRLAPSPYSSSQDISTDVISDYLEVLDSPMTPCQQTRSSSTPPTSSPRPQGMSPGFS
jgi:hypothetical protein